MEEITIVLNKEKDFSNLESLIKNDFDIRMVFSDLVEERLYHAQRLYDVYHQDEYIGFCALIKYEKATFALDLGISEKHRGKGYSNEIFKYVLGDIKHINNRIYCETQKVNTPANKLIQNHGFKKYQSLKGMNKYYLDPPDFSRTK